MREEIKGGSYWKSPKTFNRYRLVYLDPEQWIIESDPLHKGGIACTFATFHNPERFEGPILTNTQIEARCSEWEYLGQFSEYVEAEQQRIVERELKLGWMI